LIKASCRRCEKITSTFEKETSDHIVTPIREHLGLMGRKQTRPRPLMPVNLLNGQVQTRLKVSQSDHPAVMFMLKFAEPTLFQANP
jgi:hypothetical protein